MPKTYVTKTGAVVAIISSLCGMYTGAISLPEGCIVIGGAIQFLGLGKKLDRLAPKTE